MNRALPALKYVIMDDVAYVTCHIVPSNDNTSIATSIATSSTSLLVVSHLLHTLLFGCSIHLNFHSVYTWLALATFQIIYLP